MFETLKSLHLLALLLGGGASVGGAILMRQVAASGQPPSVVVQKTVAGFGQAGLGAILLLWLTGIPLGLMTGAFATGGMIFSIKLVFATLVLILVVAMTRLRLRAAAAGTPPPALLMARLASAARVSIVLAIVLAVVAFE
jgi:hypothetical protein